MFVSPEPCQRCGYVATQVSPLTDGIRISDAQRDLSRESHMPCQLHSLTVGENRTAVRYDIPRTFNIIPGHSTLQ